MADHPAHIDGRYVALGGKDKRIFVADRAVAEVGVKNRVVKGFSDFKVGHTFDQLRVNGPGIRPKAQLFNVMSGNVSRDLQRLHHRLFININPAARHILHARPFRLLEPGASGKRDVFELRKISVEAVQNDTGKAVLFVHWRPL